MSATPTDASSSIEPTLERTRTEAERTAARTVPDDVEGHVITDFEEAPYPALVAGAKASAKTGAFALGAAAGADAAESVHNAILGLSGTEQSADGEVPGRSSVDELIELHETTSKSGASP